jgi:deazaflavin-dependent oxidoreductase (nitroreductase family)
MSKFQSLPRPVLRALKIPVRTLYALGLGVLVGRRVLLLTTKGRRSGLPRPTPLQYERIDGEIVVGSMRGERADWVRNILQDPAVVLQIGRNRVPGVARLIRDVEAIADFLEYRFQKHPRFMRMISRLEGLPYPPSREHFERYAEGLCLVAIKPENARR